MAAKEFLLKPTDITFIQEHSPVGDYFTFDEAYQVVHLHDVVTRKPLQPGQLPEGVMQHDDIRSGYEYLQKQGEAGKLTIDLVLGGHGCLDDFTSMTLQHHNVLTRAAVLGLEMDWRQRDNIPHNPRHITPLLTDPQADPGRYEFQTAQVLWSGHSGVTTVPCELAKDDDSVLAIELRHLWQDIVVPMQKDTQLSPAIKHAAASIAKFAYQANRQPTLPGRLGKELQNIDECTAIAAPYRAALVLGSWHARTEQRLGTLGIPVEAHHTPPIGFTTEAWRTYGNIAMSAQYTGRVTLAGLCAMQPIT